MKDVAPAATVVIVSYQGRPRIDMPLRALAQQDCVESFEVIVVASGTDGCANRSSGTSLASRSSGRTIGSAPARRAIGVSKRPTAT